MTLIAHFDMDLSQMNMKMSFLNGDLEEKIYMKEPKGFSDSDNDNNRLVCKLKTSTYGLKQASRQ